VTGCSPHHLSRVFTQLAGLAGDLGFADHAHLTRTVRAATGRTPSSLRAAFRAAGPWRSVGGHS